MLVFHRKSSRKGSYSCLADMLSQGRSLHLFHTPLARVLKIYEGLISRHNIIIYYTLNLKLSRLISNVSDLKHEPGWHEILGSP